MKKIVSVSLGSSTEDFDFQGDFLGETFQLQRIGCDGDFDKAEQLMKEYDGKVDAIGIGNVKFPYTIGPKHLTENRVQRIQELSKDIKTPVTTGAKLRKVSFEWAIRHLQFTMGNYFTNSRILLLAGMVNYNLAQILSEYTENMTFADPILEHGIPKFLNSLSDLESYAKGLHPVLKTMPGKKIASSTVPIKAWNSYILKKAMQKAFMIMVPYHDFYDYLGHCTLEELGKKIVMTSTVYDDRIKFLKERGVDVIIDITPMPLDRVVDVNVLEAMVLAHLGKREEEVTNDDMLEIISEAGLEPRVIYPQGEKKRMNRFAFVIHPLSQNDFKKEKSISALTKIPKVTDALEKAMAYSPPFLYSKVSGIKSPTGVETEGWLISVGGTPKQMLAHTPEFTYKRLLQAATMAKKLGAQIMGLGAFTKVVGDAGVTVSRQAELPITTGNSYSASGAIWAAADAVRRMGLIQVEKGKLLEAKSMVVGATGAIGSVCSRLIALAASELYMVGRNTAKLLALKESILKESPHCKIVVTTQADKYLADMDIIVTTTSGAGKKVLDIMKVKPGGVVTDVARPLDLKPEDVVKRPDILVIESGEIKVPGDPKYKSIGLPPGVIYACLAETIVLTLEGRFEVFTIGRGIEWEKVKEIYQMGLKHGMKLAAISGVNGVYSDEDIAKVRDLAVEARKTWVCPE